ncbi:phosphatase PAP2 family protein [Allobranchiibius sp. GilTou38]|nr:phosphatase PAP2 family protein [Allobranchiibius sp. GilTou38]
MAMRAPGQRGWYWRGPVELAVLAALDFAYESLRNLVPNQRSRGDALASKINALEVHLRWGLDLRLNHALITHPHLAQLVNDYYSWLFLPVTLTVLTWVFLRHQHHYRHVRTVLVAVTLIALACFYLYPMAPPRLLPGGAFIDTSHLFPTWGSWSTPTVADNSNQYAAMPSLHCAWALWNGLVIAHLARRTWVRALGILYPVLTYLAVIATANHFTIDALGGLATTAAVFAITTAPRRSLLQRRHQGVAV